MLTSEVRHHRLVLAAGISAITAATLVPAQHPAALSTPPIHLVADVAPLDLGSLSAAPAATASIGSVIENLYLAVEPWTRYGVNLTAWLAGWVPFAGLLAPQLNFGYDLGEAITRSWVFNTAGLLDGDLALSQAFANIGGDTAAAFDAYFAAQINWVTHLLPPLPPIPSPPPLPPIAEAVPMLDSLGEADAAGLPDPEPLPDLLDTAP